MEYKIRKCELSDCKDIARIVTISWNETYKGIVPDWFLEELKSNEDERTKNSIEKFDKNNNNQLVLEVDDKVVGFANFGKSDDEEYENCGEIFALYIIGEYKGKGYGRKLVNEAGGNEAAACAVLAEGDAKDRDDIIYLEPLPLFFK